IFMFVLSNFIVSIVKVLDIFLQLFVWIIIFRALISWVNPDPYNKIVVFLYRITEPVLAPIRRMLPLGGFGIDLSPLVVVAIIYFLQNFLIKSLLDIAYRM
ncbi:MAG: YggT family protein, partial [Deltaproteobacteria bacterium]